MSFSISVERLVARWQQEGLIDADTAARLNADLDQRAPGFSLGTVLATLGGLLLGAAVIMLVAANWQDMPRLMRVALIFVLIWASYLAGAWRQSRGDRLFASALYVLGAASFGAGIALVGQMYNLSGDVHSAVAVWSLGVLAAAFLLRAPVLATFGAGVACFYLSTFVFDATAGDFSYRWMGPVLFAAGVASALFTRARPAAHVWALFVIGWAMLLYAEGESEAVPVLLLLAGFGLMLICGLARDALQQATRFAEPLAAYGLLAALMALAIFQTRNMLTDPGAYAGLDRDVVYGIAILALSVGALALCGRNNGGLRAIAYAAFSVEVLYLASATVGSMIGTSGFFLTAGILVLLLAAFVRRMENRFGGRQRAEVRP